MVEYVLELVLFVLKFFLRPFSLGDVTDDPRGVPAFIHLETRKREFYWKRLPILSESNQLCNPPHCVSMTGQDKILESGPVSGTIFRRSQQLVNVFSYYL